MEILRAGARSLGLNLGPQHLARFEVYYRELTAWNTRFNLTTITGYEEVQLRHFVDSLTCLVAFPQEGLGDTIPDTVPIQRGGMGLRCIDIGTGAGFPGLPLKIMLPDMHLTLVESVGKKVAFLRHIVRVLDLKGVEILQGRAEEIAHWETHREGYDVAVARAVAHLAVLVEYCLPFCRLGGRLVAPKGEDAQEEALAAQEAISLLGGVSWPSKPSAFPRWQANTVWWSSKRPPQPPAATHAALAFRPSAPWASPRPRINKGPLLNPPPREGPALPTPARPAPGR